MFVQCLLELKSHVVVMLPLKNILHVGSQRDDRGGASCNREGILMLGSFKMHTIGSWNEVVERMLAATPIL